MADVFVGDTIQIGSVLYELQFIMACNDGVVMHAKKVDPPLHVEAQLSDCLKYAYGEAMDDERFERLNPESE